MSEIRVIKAKIEYLARSARAWSVLAWAVPAILYISTLPTVPVFEGSAEFVTAAVTAGVPHPSGYPVYVLLAHLFTWLPVGELPWRVVLLSALAATGAIWLAHDLAVRLAERVLGRLDGLRRLAIWATVMTTAVTVAWWSQAIYAQVYPLHALLTVLAFWLLAQAWANRSHGFLIAACAIYGVALANHFTLALIQAPFFYSAVFMARPSFFRPRHWPKWLLADGLTLALFLLPYAWLLWRAGQDPGYMTGQPVGWSGLLDLLLRRDYDEGSVTIGEQLKVSLVVLGQQFVHFGWLATALAAVGGWRLWQARTEPLVKVLGLAALGTILAAPLTVLFRSAAFSPETFYVARVYGLAAWPFLAVMAALGATWLIGRVRVRSLGDTGLFLLILLVLFWPYYQFGRTGLQLPAYTHPFPYQHVRTMLTSLPDRAVLLVSDPTYVHDTVLYNLAYLQTVEGVRRDVTVMEDSGINSMIRPQVKAAEYNLATPLDARRRLMLDAAFRDTRLLDRPLFATFPAEVLGEPLRSMSNGLVFAISRPGQPAPASRPVAVLELPGPQLLAAQPALAQQAAHYHYTQAAYLQDQQGSQSAGRELLRAMRWDNWPFSQDYLAFQQYRAVRLQSSLPAPGDR